MIMEEAKLMEFSSDLLVEILARLPSSRAAIQLKLVCKRWCSLISSHYFISVFNHRRHDPSSLPPPIIHPSGCFIFQSVLGRCLSMVRWGDLSGGKGDFHRLDFSFLPCPQSTIRFKASCADLILFSTSTSTSSCYFSSQPLFYYVSNLLTKHWVALPPAPQFQLDLTRYVAMSTGFLCVPASCSLCPHNINNNNNNNNNNNFMVVRICVSRSSVVHSEMEFKAQLFSSSSGEWKSVGVVPSPRPVRFRVRSSDTLVPYKGMLHWLISEFVLVYDPYNCPQKFSRVIDMPPHIVMPPERRYPAEGPQTIGLFQDRLRVTHVSGVWIKDPVYCIWELEDYNMGKWSLVHTIRRTATHPRPILNNLNPPNNIRDTEFSYTDGSVFYWTSSGWWVANGIVHWITHHCWPTPLPPLTCTIQNNENTLGNS